MKYIIMADGKGTRWQNYNDIPKHLALIDGEPVIKRTVRLIKEADSTSEVIITSHDERYEVEGASRYEPKNNVLEVDRFTFELIEDDITFLYGDTVYSKEGIEKIASFVTDDVEFFGNEKSIVAVKIHDSKSFIDAFQKVRNLFLDGKIEKCIGWQVYSAYLDREIYGDERDKIIGNNMVKVVDSDFNTPKEYITINGN